MPLQESERIEGLLDRHGQLFSAELGIDLAQNTPSPLFRWLCAKLLLSARISHTVAIKAARALSDAGMTTAQHMIASTLKDRVAILNDAGYGRFDEGTARMLGDTAQLVASQYGGDLRQQREATDRNPKAEREALKACKGIGDVGADIFLREMQSTWPENYPFADAKALAAAKRLSLPETPEKLAKLVDQKCFPTFVAALVRAELAGTTTNDLEDHSAQASAQ